MNNSPITKARLIEKALRIQFEEEKRLEWKEWNDSARAKTAEAVWNAYTSGMPVTQIARYYGTTSRGTIYAILNRERSRLEAKKMKEQAE